MKLSPLNITLLSLALWALPACPDQGPQKGEGAGSIVLGHNRILKGQINKIIGRRHPGGRLILTGARFEAIAYNLVEIDHGLRILGWKSGITGHNGKAYMSIVTLTVYYGYDLSGTRIEVKDGVLFVTLPEIQRYKSADDKSVESLAFPYNYKPLDKKGKPVRLDGLALKDIETTLGDKHREECIKRNARLMAESYFRSIAELKQLELELVFPRSKRKPSAHTTELAPDCA